MVTLPIWLLVLVGVMGFPIAVSILTVLAYTGYVVVKIVKVVMEESFK